MRQSFVDGKRISLAVRGDAAKGFRLERRSSSPGEPVSTQYLDLQDKTAAAAFIEHDPYAVQLTNDYRAVLPVEDPREQHVAHATLPEFASDCENERELLLLMRGICQALGATQCFYHWFVLDEQAIDFETHDLLVGGAPAWAQRYVHQHWHLNDPAAAHARDEARPLRGSSLVSLPASHWLRQQAQAHGMRSNVFFPAHRRDDPMFGLLHVSTPLPPPQGEEPLWRHRRTFTGLADELLDWRVTRVRQELARRLSLSYTEVLALRLIERGGSARHVAEELKIGERAVYQLFLTINRKMDSRHIKSSASKAKRYGLLREAVFIFEQESSTLMTQMI